MVDGLCYQKLETEDDGETRFTTVCDNLSASGKNETEIKFDVVSL